MLGGRVRSSSFRKDYGMSIAQLLKFVTKIGRRGKSDRRPQTADRRVILWSVAPSTGSSTGSERGSGCVCRVLEVGA